MFLIRGKIYWLGFLMIGISMMQKAQASHVGVVAVSCVNEQAAPDPAFTSGWMGRIFKERPHTVLKAIVLPGTHNSGSYNIGTTSRRAPGTPLWYVGPTRNITAGWSKCQNRSLGEQLHDGIRYFDWRIAFDNHAKAVIVHGLESISLTTALAEVNTFVEAQPAELILISASLSHEYAATLTPSQRPLMVEAMYQQIASGSVRSILLPKEGVGGFQSVGDLPLNYFWQSDKSVAIIRGFKANWFNKQLIDELKHAADAYLANGNDELFGIDLILTPRAQEIAGGAGRLWGALRGHYGLYEYQKPLINNLRSWIAEWAAKKHRLNIVTLDFYEKAGVVEELIRLNEVAC